MGTVSLAFFAIIFYNKITRIVSASVVALSAFIIFFTFERWERQAEHLYYAVRMVRGYMYYRPELGTTVLWAMCLMFGLVVAVFMLYRFSFYLLAVTGIAVFLLTWGPGFTRDASSFLIFLVCFCLILIRKTNNGLSAVYAAAPICMALVLFVQSSVPVEADLFERRTLQDLFEGPLAAVGDFIFVMTNPMYFTFQSTGFSGHGGRLGGPITPNNRNVMTVMAPGRTYLAGATHNTFTGYSWITTLEPGQLYTQGMHASQFEMLETMTALIRNVGRVSDRSHLSSHVLWDMFPAEDHRLLSTDNFPTLGFTDSVESVGMHRLTAMMETTEAILSGSELSSMTIANIIKNDDGEIISIETEYNNMIIFPQHGRIIWIDDYYYVDIRYLHAFLPMSQVTIAIGSNRTGTVFRPQNTRSIAFHPAGADYLPSLMFDSTGDMRTPGFMSRGTQYTLNFLNVNPRLSFVGGLLDSSFQGFHQAQGEQGIFQQHWQHDITATAQDINDLFEMFAFPGTNRVLQYVPSYSYMMAMLDSFSRDVLARYAETVREHFMYVPEIVPQRVHDLVAEIIYGRETDYERVMAIRDFLVQFPYTLNPQPVPPGVCFVDHFLFVGQEGYCTYYASAMAIMSRIAGVPSRYVEGFLLPAAPPESEDGTAIFAVTNMMAHAWVEVYLEGFGWLIVEATAEYAFDNDDVIAPPPVVIPPSIPYYLWPPDMWDQWDDYWDMPLTPGSPGTPQGPGPYETPTGMITMATVRIILLVIFLIVAVTALVFLLRQYVKIRTVIKRVGRMPINQRITTYFTGILDIASHVTGAKDPAETPHVYGQRVGMRFAFRNDSKRLRDLVALYYRARYGAHELSEEEGIIMEDSYFDMITYLRAEHKKSRFFYLRYILRIGAI